MKKNILSIGLAIFCLFYIDSVSALQIVFVDAKGGNGSGISFSRGSECFVLTARHIVSKPGPITVIGDDKKMADAVVDQEYSDDIAILRIKKGVEICKSSKWPNLSNIETTIEKNPEGYLKGGSEDGGFINLPIYVSHGNDMFLTILPRGSTKELVQGSSGSIVMLNNQAVAFLLQVNIKNGEGKAIRMDYAAKIIDKYLYQAELPQEEEPEIAINPSIKVSVKSVPVAVSTIGKAATINVTVTSENGNRLSYALVRLKASGGVFVQTDLDNVVGRTDSNGRFQPVWRCNRQCSDSRYHFEAIVTKNEYKKGFGEGDVTIEWKKSDIETASGILLVGNSKIFDLDDITGKRIGGSKRSIDELIKYSGLSNFKRIVMPYPDIYIAFQQNVIDLYVAFRHPSWNLKEVEARLKNVSQRTIILP